jgi:hypothetical protein
VSEDLPLFSNGVLSLAALKGRDDVKEVGFGLLYRIPFAGGGAFNVDTFQMKVDMIQWQDEDIVGVGVMALGVEPKYLGEVDRLAPAENERLERSEGLQRSFRDKVEEELGDDAEVLAIEREIGVATAKIAGLVEARQQRRAKLREERMGLETSYRYVADEREL